MSAPAMVGRREFLKTGAAAGGGLLVSWYLPVPSAGAGTAAAGENQVALNAFVRIGTDESVTVISSHSEMGQGIYTSLPMLLNEELEADWSKIRVEAAPVDKVYNHPVFGMQMTGGSTTTPGEWEHYRKMGALARTGAGDGGGATVECGCRELPGREWRSAASRDGTTGDVWLAGECRGANYTSGGSEAEGREEFHADWETHAAPGYTIENERERAVWAGRQLAGNAYGGGGAAAGIWRESGEG